MKVFVSWSGDTSREAAELVRQWLPNVIQEVDVWVSSQDIGKGEKWSSSLWENLSEIEFGLLMVTRGNSTAPWIMFEAGALSKTVKSKVIPILCDLERLDIASTPLSQFQNSLVSKDEIWQVIVAANSACERSMDESRLRLTFEKWWPDFESQFGQIKFADHSTQSKTSGAKEQNIRLEKIEGALESIMRTIQRDGRYIERVNSFKLPGRIVRMGDGRAFVRDINGKLRRLADPSPPPPPPTTADSEVAEQNETT